MPLPIFYGDDLSIDHAALERYTHWIAEAGIGSLCLTYSYSQLGFITASENLQITRVFAEAANGRAVCFASTRGEPLQDALPIVDELYGAGADGVFVMPPMAALESGPDYARVLLELLQHTEAPILAMSFPTPSDHSTPLLSMDLIDRLVAHERFIGLKDDVNVPAQRLKLIDRYGDRLAIIGGGSVRNLMQFSHYPCQSELDGYFCPRRALRFSDAVTAGRLHEALAMIEQWEHVTGRPADIQWQTRNQVTCFTLGYASTYRMRPPLSTPTEAQAARVCEHVKAHRDVFEPLGS